MDRRSVNRGATRKGCDRIQFDFMLDGVRYRPSIRQTPTEANLQRAREYLLCIKERIRAGTFSFAEEFPDFRNLHAVVDPSQMRTCNQVFDEFLDHCESRLARNDMAAATVASYKKSLETTWRPPLGSIPFLQVRYSQLVKIADKNSGWRKKTYNNALSVLRRAFAFGYRNHPYALNPATALRSARVTRKDRPKADPFEIQEAEKLIAGIHRDWGEAQGNYDEFRFFTGLRPSEQIALRISDFRAADGTLCVSKARVNGIDKDCTKTREDRVVELCPRALAVLHRQLALRERLCRAGKIYHDHLFFHAGGEPIRQLRCPAPRWRQTLKRLASRYRRPYTARHSSVSCVFPVSVRSAYGLAFQLRACYFLRHGHSAAISRSDGEHRGR